MALKPKKTYRTHALVQSTLALAVVFSACGIGSLESPETAQLLGTYHLPGQADEVNLTLRPDHTFRWRIVGCDFGAVEDGRWVSEGDRIRLNPKPGRSEFFWVKEPTFQHRVTTLVVSRVGDNLNIVGADLDQKWNPGRICARCGTPGYLGPSGLDTCEDQSGL